MHPAHPLPFTHSTLFSGEDSSFLILIIFKSFMIRFFHFDFVIRLFGFDFVICFSFWWQKDQSGQKNQIIWIKRVGLIVGSNMFWQTIWTHHVSLSIIYVSFMYFNWYWIWEHQYGFCFCFFFLLFHPRPDQIKNWMRVKFKLVYFEKEKINTKGLNIKMWKYKYQMWEIEVIFTWIM